VSERFLEFTIRVKKGGFGWSTLAKKIGKKSEKRFDITLEMWYNIYRKNGKGASLATDTAPLPPCS